MKNKKKIFGFAGLIIAMFIGTLDSTITNIALPTITTYFKSNLNDTTWITTIYVLGLSVFMITASKLADQFGRKKTMLAGLTLFGASSAMCGLSHSLLFLIVMRFIQGIGGAIVTPVVLPMGIELFGKEKTRIISGITGAFVAIAAAGGPTLGGVLIEYINWQSVFFINVPFCIIAFILILVCTEESYDNTVSKNIDWAGMLLLSAALFLITFSLLKGNDYGWESNIIRLMIAGAAASFLFFIFTESKVKAPMVELGLFKEITFTASSVCYMLAGFAIAGQILIFNYFLQNVLDYTPLKAGLVVMWGSLTVVISMPLGNVIASKAGARPVNFLGLVIMGISLMSLSKLDVNTSKAAMVGDMVICGAGLGFACQAIVSSIKHIPKEKNGIASGIVNAARQVGTCIGIALLVGVLNTNVANAKNTVRNDAITAINQNVNISNSIKKVMVKDIKKNLNSSNKDKTSPEQQKTMQRTMQNDIKKAIIGVKAIKKQSSDSPIANLYNLVSLLNSGAHNMRNGQYKLNNGIKPIYSGIDRLYIGSGILTAELAKLSNVTNQAKIGVQKIKTASGNGIDALISNMCKINNGMQRVRTQCLPANGNGLTIYDGVKGVSAGTEKLSSSVTKYVSYVNDTLYQVIKNDPMSSLMLNAYKNKLSQLQSVYIKSEDSAQKQLYAQKIKALSSIINVYSAATDSSVKDEKSFEVKLITQAHSNPLNQTIVSAGNDLIKGSDKLSAVSKNVSSQFEKNGMFRNGIEQLAQGTDKLYNNSKKFGSLKDRIGKVEYALSGINKGTSKLYTASKKLQNGLMSAKEGISKIYTGSLKLENASNKISTGTSVLAENVGKLGQKNEVMNEMNNIKASENRELSNAFDKTFMLGAIILFATSIIGLFTDKKTKEEEKTAFATEKCALS